MIRLHLELDRGRLDRLFPAWLQVGPDGTISGCGPALTRHVPDGLAGRSFAALFPATGALAAHAESGAPLQLQLGAPSLHLSGTVLPAGGGFLLALNLIPLGASVGDSALGIGDFAPTDPVVPAMLLAGLQAALIEESREIASELAEERQRTVDLLERVSRAAGHMAHEFNNIVSIIGLNCDRLLRDHAGNPGTARLAGMIRETARRGSFITQSLMTLANQQDDSDQLFVLDEVIGGHRSYFALLAGAEIEFDCSLGAGAAQVRLSHSGLVNCLAHLLVAAGEGAGAGGRVCLSTHAEEDGMVELRVHTPAAGVAAREAVAGAAGAWFALYPLAGARATSANPVERFVREAGGAIAFETGEGGARCVRLSLPLAGMVQHAAGGALGPAPQHRAERAAPPRVLVVDDEPYALEALTELLGAMGYAVTACDNAPEALAALQRAPFDVLLTDVIMPHVGGLELAERATRHDPALGVVLMSGYLPEGGVQRPEWLFLRKPLDVARLDSVLRDCRRGPE